MSRQIAGRVTLAVIAAAFVAVAVLHLRSLTLREDGEQTLATAGARTPEAAAVVAAAADLKRARRFSADPTARLDEAELMLSVGRTAAAIDLLEPVVHDNAGSVRGWSLLARATATTDAHLHAVANTRLLDFYGHLPRPRLTTPSLRTPSGRVVTVIARRVRGFVDGALLTPRTAVVRGWAANVVAQRAAEDVIVVTRGRVVGTFAPSEPRPDLTRGLGAAARGAGFTIQIPRRALERRGRIDVQIYGVDGQVATAIPFFCKGRKLAFGC